MDPTKPPRLDYELNLFSRPQEVEGMHNNMCELNALQYKSFTKQYAPHYGLHAYTLLGSSRYDDETGVTWRIH
jgi:hypothetical protein